MANRQAESILLSTEQELSNLLLGAKLARAYALNALHQLDAERKRSLIDFLYNANLINTLQPHFFTSARMTADVNESLSVGEDGGEIGLDVHEHLLWGEEDELKEMCGMRASAAHSCQSREKDHFSVPEAASRAESFTEAIEMMPLTTTGEEKIAPPVW